MFVSFSHQTVIRLPPYTLAYISIFHLDHIPANRHGGQFVLISTHVMSISQHFLLNKP